MSKSEISADERYKMEKSGDAFSFANSRIFMDRFILKVNESIESHDDSKKAKLSIGSETFYHKNYKFNSRKLKTKISINFLARKFKQFNVLYS